VAAPSPETMAAPIEPAVEAAPETKVVVGDYADAFEVTREQFDEAKDAPSLFDAYQAACERQRVAWAERQWAAPCLDLAKALARPVRKQASR
jgi:hypothetical protein